MVLLTEGFCRCFLEQLTSQYHTLLNQNRKPSSLLQTSFFFNFSQLLPQRCTWLYVMNNVLMSVSGRTLDSLFPVFFPYCWQCFFLTQSLLSTGKSSQLYSHNLLVLFEQSHLQRKNNSLSFSSHCSERLKPRYETMTSCIFALCFDTPVVVAVTCVLTLVAQEVCRIGEDSAHQRLSKMQRR